MIKLLTGHDLNRQMIDSYVEETKTSFRVPYKNLYTKEIERFFEFEPKYHASKNDLCVDLEHLCGSSLLIDLFNLLDHKDKKVCFYKPFGDCHPVFQAKFARIMCELHQRNGHSFVVLTNSNSIYYEVRRCIALKIIKLEDVKIDYYWNYCCEVPMVGCGECSMSFNPNKLFEGDLTCEQLSDIFLYDQPDFLMKYPVKCLLDCIMENKKVDVHPNGDCMFGYYSSREIIKDEQPKELRSDKEKDQ